jgi:tellurite resistance protein
MARRRAKVGTGTRIILAGLSIPVLGLGVQASHDTWPFLLMGLGGLGCVWGLARKKAEAASAATVHPPQVVSAPINLEAMRYSIGSVPEPSRRAFGKREPDFGLLRGPMPNSPKGPTTTASAGIGPEFHITAIVEPPPRALPRTERGKSGTRGAARWIPAGEPVTIHGLTISSGLIYVGAKLGDDRWQSENCLIDPSLPVAPAGRGSTDGMPYWARYGAVTPAIRRAYLDWLAAGRTAADVQIGLVFLFFYGLEYRLFKEAVLSDGPAIVAEVERLRERYGESSSFQGYATRFLEAAHLVLPSTSGTRPDTVLDQPVRNFELPLDVRVWLGRKLAAGEALDSEDALLWLASLPDRSFRTPVARCPEVFRALWRLRFAERYPGGLKVTPPKSRLKATYRAASGTFDVPLRGAHQDLPDIGSLTGPVRKLRDLVEACSGELDSYSRFVGRRPEARSSTEAALLLPDGLAVDGTAWEAVRARAETALAGRDTAPVQLSDLFAIAGLSLLSVGRVPQAPMQQLGRVLDRVDIAFEPDRRYGGSLPDAGSNVCLFRGARGAPVDIERTEYRTYRDLIDIACLAAASDGTIEPAEIETVLATLRASTTLLPVEKSRLTAYALSIAQDPPKQQTVLKRAAARSQAERQAFADAALVAVIADGQATPSEVRFLERLHKALGLPADAIYTGIHRGAQPTAEPADGDLAASQPSINASQVPSGAVAIDTARLERIRRETQAVSNLLSDIFIDEASPVVPTSAPTAELPRDTTDPADDTAVLETFRGLDPTHAELLATLLTLAEPIPRAVFEKEARQRRLLPDGAMETINEWAFDHFGDALLEGEDDLSVAAHLRDQLPALEAAA